MPIGLSKLQVIRAIECDLAEILVRRPTCCFWASRESTSSRPPNSPARWGRSSTTPRPERSPGRAGLFPSRYQSDEVDRPDGPLVRRANRDLRRAILMIADNLIKCNEHFGVLAAGWRLKKADARDIRVRVAGRFCRIAFQMVAGRMIFRHPCTQKRDYILTKLDQILS